MVAHEPRTSRKRMVLGIALLSLILPAANCPNVDFAMLRARIALRSIVRQLEPPAGSWRVHWKLLKKDTKVSSFKFLPTDDPQTYTCRGWCVLFFLDLNPYAHFAHPTRILVYDSKPENENKPIFAMKPSKWWPTIQELSWTRPVSVFDTVAEREDPLHVFEVGRVPGELPPPETLDYLRPALIGHVTVPSGAEPLPGVALIPTPTPVVWTGAAAAPCDSLPVWAILVNGYNDPTNTFDEDVVGMYSVLKGFGVHEGRIRVLSPFALPGITNSTQPSRTAVIQTFDFVKSDMQNCVTAAGGDSPHFLLFWSSHGAAGALGCDQELVYGGELGGWISNLDGVWSSVGATLEDTIVIEACESGSVGQSIYDMSGAHRRILTSAGGEDNVSYRDIDEKVGIVEDPNPADIGSETVWGYVEAFGAATADANPDGMIVFDEAVQYAKDHDVVLQGLAAGGGGAATHEVKVWTPTPPNPSPVHGSWNTSPRIGSSVVFAAPATTVSAFAGPPVKARVVPGEIVDVKVEIKKLGAGIEKGSLALRLFRNDETTTSMKWAPKYYVEDNNRTTFMISGLSSTTTVPPSYKIKIPTTFSEGDTMRLVVTLDSAQKIPAFGESIEAMPKSEIILEVGENCTSFCCWWKSLWD